LTQYDGIQWFNDQKMDRQPGGLSAKTSGRPGVAVYNDQLHVVYKGSGNNYLYHMYFDGKQWMGDYRIQVAGSTGYPQTNHGVCLVEFNGKLYVVYKGKSDEDLRWMSYDGAVWNGDWKIRDTGSTQINPKTNGSNPGMVVYNRTLYIFYKGTRSNTIYLSTFDGKNWAGNESINHNGFKPETTECPTAFVYGADSQGNGGVLQLIYKGTSTHLYSAQYSAGTWSGNQRIEVKTSDGRTEVPESTQSPGFGVVPLASALGSADWMTNNFAIIGDKTFGNLTLPSSHDSGMHIAKGTPSNEHLYAGGTRTQELDIYSQIVFGGARVLDLRPVYYESSDLSNVGSGFYAAHYTSLLGTTAWGGLMGQPLEEICQNLKDALDALAVNETLVITVSKGKHLKEAGLMKDLSAADQSIIIDQLLKACAGHLYSADDNKRVDFFGLTPKTIAALGTGPTAFVVCTDSSFRDCGRKQSDGLFQEASMLTKSTWWDADTDDQYKFYADTQQAIRSYNGSKGALFLAWQLTWQLTSTRTLKDFAKEINPTLGQHLADWRLLFNSDNRPAMIGWNFVGPVTADNGEKDPTFTACLTFGGLKT
jgi:hypothetical protein